MSFALGLNVVFFRMKFRLLQVQIPSTRGSNVVFFSLNVVLFRFKCRLQTKLLYLQYGPGCPGPPRSGGIKGVPVREETPQGVEQHHREQQLGGTDNS